MFLVTKRIQVMLKLIPPGIQREKQRRSASREERKWWSLREMWSWFAENNSTVTILRAVAATALSFVYRNHIKARIDVDNETLMFKMPHIAAPAVCKQSQRWAALWEIFSRQKEEWSLMNDGQHRPPAGLTNPLTLLPLFSLCFTGSEECLRPF